MFTIMLNPHFKSLWVVKNYLECEDTIQILFFSMQKQWFKKMTYFNVLDLTIQECTTTIDGSSDVIEKKTSLLLTHLLKFFHMYLLLENYL